MGITIGSVIKDGFMGTLRKLFGLKSKYKSDPSLEFCDADVGQSSLVIRSEEDELVETVEVSATKEMVAEMGIEETEADKEKMIENLKNQIKEMTIEEMYNTSEFSIYHDMDDEEDDCIGDGKWYLYKSICQLGGCDFNGTPYETEREALEQAVLMTLQGKKPAIFACPDCYREYMADCI